MEASLLMEETASERIFPEHFAEQIAGLESGAGDMDSFQLPICRLCRLHRLKENSKLVEGKGLLSVMIARDLFLLLLTCGILR